MIKKRHKSDDAGKVFKAHGQAKESGRVTRRKSALDQLRLKAIPFESKNDDRHLILRPRGGEQIIDYWPDTMRWVVRGEDDDRIGFRALLEYCQTHSEAAQPTRGLNS